MRKSVAEESFFQDLMNTVWFRETVNLYADGQHFPTYERIMKEFLRRGIVKVKDGQVYTTVKP